MIANAISNGDMWGGSFGTQVSQQDKPTFYQEIAQRLGLNMGQFDKCVADRKYQNRVEEDYQLGQRVGISGTPGGFVNGQALQGAIPYEQLKTIIDAELKSPSSFPAQLTIAPQEHIRGNLNAPVTIVEFSDFECPFCRRFHPTAQQALAEYGDRVRWVYKHFPIDQIHPQARPAAEVSECIAEQKGNEGFWQFADIIFENQDRLKDITL